MTDRNRAVVSYVVAGTTDVEAWAEMATVLGLDVVPADGGGLRLRMDDRLARVFVEPSDHDGVVAMGWELPDDAALEATVDRARRHGCDVGAADPALAARRCVGALHATQDPAGFRVELVARPHIEAVERFVSPGGQRFVTGPEGMGHITMRVQPYGETVAFYRDVLALQVRDTIALALRATFLGSSSRHHSCGIIAKDDGVELAHVMIEVDDLDDLGRALDAADAAGLPVTKGLGRHWNDRMVSFYVTTPSGFDIEYGWGGIKVDRETWTEVQQAGVGGASIWGHRLRPALR